MHNPPQSCPTDRPNYILSAAHARSMISQLGLSRYDCHLEAGINAARAILMDATVMGTHARVPGEFQAEPFTLYGLEMRVNKLIPQDAFQLVVDLVPAQQGVLIERTVERAGEMEVHLL